MKLKSIVLKTIFFLFLFLIFLFPVIISNPKIYNNFLTTKEKLNSKFFNYGFEIVINLSDKLNVIKLFNKLKYNNLEVISLKISENDKIFLNKQINKFKELGFIKDEINKFRNAKIVDGLDEIDIKFKIQGTSAIDLNEDNFNLTIKNSDQDKYSLIRISEFSDENIPTLILNNFANKFNLLSPDGKIVNLKINDGKKLLYYRQINPNINWFRLRNINNYLLLKNYDDWDKKNYGHTSDLDLNEKNLKTSGNSSDEDIAIGYTKLLFDAVKNNDLNTIYNLIDENYFAKFLALAVLYNNSHFITGDNLKYVFDLDSLKFKILFRAESFYVIPIKNNVENFNNSLFEDNTKYIGSLNHKFFKVLVGDKNFRLKRDKYLLELINRKNEILEFSNKIYKDAYKNIIFSDINSIKNKFLMDTFFKNLEYNFDKIQKYLDYAKIYGSIERIGTLNKIYLINDSFIPHEIVSIFTSDGIEVSDISFELPSLYKVNGKFKYEEKIFSFESPSPVKMIRFKNKLNHKILDQSQVYLNKIKFIE